MADTQSKKVLGATWASASMAETEAPEDVGITRSTGYTLPYEQIGSGSEPERTVVNQLFRELNAWMTDNMRYGGVKPWDGDINYLQYARATVGRSKYYASVETGPVHGNSVNPTASGQTVWRLY